MIKTKENYIFVERFIWTRRVIVFVSLGILFGVPFYYRHKMSISNYIGWVLLFFLYYGFLYLRFLKKMKKEKIILENGLRAQLKHTGYEESYIGKYPVYFPVFYKKGYGVEIVGINEVPFFQQEVGAIKDIFYFKNECVVIENSSWKEKKALVNEIHYSKQENLKDDFLQVRKILLSSWDPIGLSSEGREDRYDSYIPNILKYIRDNDVNGLSSYLLSIELESMGLTSEFDHHKDVLDSIAKKLIDEVEEFKKS